MDSPSQVKKWNSLYRTSSRTCCRLTPLASTFERHNVFSQGTVGFHNILPGCCCAVFLLPSLFLLMDVLPKEIPFERAAEKIVLIGEENQRRTIPWLGKTGKQQIGWTSRKGRKEFKKILSNRIPQQDARNSGAQASIRDRRKTRKNWTFQKETMNLFLIHQKHDSVAAPVFLYV